MGGPSHVPATCCVRTLGTCVFRSWFSFTAGGPMAQSRLPAAWPGPWLTAGSLQLGWGCRRAGVPAPPPCLRRRRCRRLGAGRLQRGRVPTEHRRKVEAEAGADAAADALQRLPALEGRSRIIQRLLQLLLGPYRLELAQLGAQPAAGGGWGTRAGHGGGEVHVQGLAAAGLMDLCGEGSGGACWQAAKHWRWVCVWPPPALGQRTVNKPSKARHGG